MIANICKINVGNQNKSHINIQGMEGENFTFEVKKFDLIEMEDGSLFWNGF